MIARKQASAAPLEETFERCCTPPLKKPNPGYRSQYKKGANGHAQGQLFRARAIEPRRIGSRAAAGDRFGPCEFRSWRRADFERALTIAGRYGQLTVNVSEVSLG